MYSYLVHNLRIYAYVTREKAKLPDTVPVHCTGFDRIITDSRRADEGSAKRTERATEPPHASPEQLPAD